MANNPFEKLNVISDALSTQSDVVDAFDPRFGELQAAISSLKQNERALDDQKLDLAVEDIRTRARELIEGSGGKWNEINVEADDGRGPKSRRGKPGKIRHIS